MVTPISLEWAGSRGMTSLIITVRSGVRKRTTITVLVWRECMHEGIRRCI